MKLISPELVQDLQQVLREAIHSHFRWEQITELHQKLAGLDEEKPPKRAPRKRK